MHGISIIILREVFEIALIVSVILASTRGLPGRMPYISGGMIAGAIGAAIIAAFTSTISNMADGMGQEILNAGILLTAAVMIGWTAVWMRVHGRELANNIKQAANNRSMWVLFAIIALAVFREGAEIVLFLFGQHVQGISWAEIFAGGTIGLAGGLAIGVLFYLGMIKLFARHFLSFTSTLLAFLAAGLAAKGVYYLAMVGLLPEFGYQIWDTSQLVANNDLLGQSLGVLIGYNATPSGIELMVYAATLALIYGGLKWAHGNARKRNALLNAAAA